MTILRCSAVTCVYNKEQLCSRGEIDVMGADAHHPKETSCGSFRERTEGGTQNSMASGCGCDKIQIDCKAGNCTYNEHCKCTAAAIDVEGHEANRSEETRCRTFECKC